LVKSKVVVAVGCGLMVATAVNIIPNIFYINYSPSLPIGLYMRIPSGEYRRGDYIVYEPDEATKTLVRGYEWHDTEPHTFLKIVGGVAGDRYSVDEKTKFFTIEGNYAGQVYETDSKGNSLPQIRGEFTVEQGRILPIATNPRSFDGRYTGTIPITSIKAKVMPLLTK